MKLYFLQGACSLAPHIALYEAGLKFETEQVDRATHKTSTGRDYYSVNPNGYVPALEIDASTVLTEVPAVLQYIADNSKETRLAPANGTLERYQMQSWLGFVSTEIHKNFSPLFVPGVSAEYQTTVKKGLFKRFDHLESRLSKHDYLLDSGYSVADIYAFVATGWGSYVGIELTKWPAIQRFRERIGARAAVQSALKAEGLI
jgi:glutathione S-transferase